MLPAHTILTASSYGTASRSHTHSTCTCIMYALNLCVLLTREKLLLTTSAVKYSSGVIQTVALYYVTETFIYFFEV